MLHSIRSRLASTCSRTTAMEKPVLEETKKLPGPTRSRDRTKVAGLFADERCSQAILDFLDDRRRKDGRPTGSRRGRMRASEASEWEDRECEEQLALLREEERLGGEE